MKKGFIGETSVQVIATEVTRKIQICLFCTVFINTALK